MTQTPYLLGHSQPEVRRLIVQAQVIAPITRRLLCEAGLEPGMSVLDVGCGVGDVAMIAAQLVGPEGRVFGLDREAQVLELARDRAAAAGISNIEFWAGPVADGAGEYDLVIGRYVLVHQQDPSEFVRLAASHVKPGGVVAFHEVLCQGDLTAAPDVPLWHRVWQQIAKGFGTGLRHPAAGTRMIEHFRHAGLGVPTLFCEVPVGGGPDSPLYEWAALTFQTLIPHLQAVGALDPELAAISDLTAQLRNAAVAVDAQVEFAHQHCGWVTV